MGRVHVELDRKTLRDEVFDGKASRELDPILRRELRVRRQRQHDLAGKLRVLARAPVPSIPSCSASRTG